MRPVDLAAGPIETWTALEPERYELLAGPSYRFDLERRDFLKALGSGLVVMLAVPVSEAQESGREAGFAEGTPKDVAAWLHVAEDGTVTAFTGKVEVGQDIRTSLSQVVADELHAPLPSVRMVMGDTDRTPFDAGTFGSRTTPQMASQLRRVGAAAREALIDLAAAQWQVDRTGLTAAEGAVRHAASGRSAGFGALTKGQKLLKTVGADTPVTPASAWTLTGRPATKVNGSDFVTGRHKYTSDLTRPGMWYGRVLRPPAIGATLVSVDTAAAAKEPDTTVVRDGDFVGVAAPSSRLAARALDAVRAEWKTSPQPGSAHLSEYLKTSAGEMAAAGGARSGRGGGPATGSVTEGLAAAHVRLEQSYAIAYIAHVPLEPRAAVAEWSDGRLTVWTGTQRPFGVRGELAEAFRIPEEKVRVIVPDTGSGYGGKHTGEAAVEAARLAKAAGKPVKLVWSREEELTWAYFRPGGLIEVRSGASRDGLLTAWEFHNYNSGTAGIRTPYAVANQKVEFHPARSPLRQGSYRALASTANHFAREAHMDELAHALGLDPLELRRRNLKDARLRAVLDAAAERFGWGARPAVGRGTGIACGVEKGGYVATCAEVSVEKSGEVRVHRVVAAFECGAIVSPDHLRNQVEGGLVMGLGGALFEAVEFEGGEILNNRLSRYRVPRFSDRPDLDVVLLDRKDLPSAGAGESPLIALAPAIAGAIFAAIGVRLRALPLAPNGVKA